MSGFLNSTASDLLLLSEKINADYYDIKTIDQMFTDANSRWANEFVTIGSFKGIIYQFSYKSRIFKQK